MIATMTLRSILWHLLFYDEYSNRYIAKVTRSSHATVGALRHKLGSLRLSWHDIESLTDQKLAKHFYPKVWHRDSSKVEPDYAEIERQLALPRKQRKTLAVLYIEHRIKYGLRAHRKTMFYTRVRQYIRHSKVCMKQYYMPGEIMFIDFLGIKARYQQQGKIVLVPVFVACLGHSKMLFCVATPDMTSSSWILAIVAAFEYFGGVPEVLQFDNAKAMVTTPGLLALLHDNARALSEHYGCICDTSRVGTPTDNSNAENGAKIVTQQLLAPMNQDLTLFSLKEVNAQLRSDIERLNQQPLQKRNISRQQLFAEQEQRALKRLPALPYTPFVESKMILVPATYLIPYQGHEYSVPYQLVGKQVLIRVTPTHLWIYHENQRVAEHERVMEPGGFTRLAAHMKPSHIAEANKNKATFMAWASDIGIEAKQLIERQYAQSSNPNSRVIGKRCLGLQKLAVKYGHDDFLNACRFVLTRDSNDFLDPADIELVIRAKAFEFMPTSVEVLHEHVRGRHYFEGNHDEC
ncbi:IS21 family transposase [Shewanella xiamenensis]|uniref:IS21 family transposase n=2 Tax=Shewanella xiamenensis TaxID=332186 RepID=UPI00313CFC5E